MHRPLPHRETPKTKTIHDIPHKSQRMILHVDLA